MKVEKWERAGDVAARWRSHACLIIGLHLLQALHA